jgi:hypothetical protein
MAVGTTPGITVDRHGQVIDKEHRGVRIYARLGHVSSAKAQERLAAEIKRVEFDLERKANNRLRLAEGAARYLLESRDKRSVNVTAWHVGC